MIDGLTLPSSDGEKTDQIGGSLSTEPSQPHPSHCGSSMTCPQQVPLFGEAMDLSGESFKRWDFQELRPSLQKQLSNGWRLKVIVQPLAGA